MNDGSVTFGPSTDTAHEGEVSATLRGRLDGSSVARIWDDAVTRLSGTKVKVLNVDASGLEYCDGAGLGFMAELRRIVTAGGGKVQFVNVSPDQLRLFQVAELKDPLAGELNPPKRSGFVIQMGQATWSVLQDVYQIVGFIGELCATLLWAAAHPRRVRMGALLVTARAAGADGLPVVALLGLLVGLILAFQTAGPLRQFGAEPLIPVIVSISVVREMGPLITAVLLAGRSGSAFAAEIGTMKVTEELAALKVMGLDPARFLVLPRVLAAVLMMPLLVAFNVVLSIAGGYIVMASLGYSLSFYVNSVLSAVNLGDFVGGLFKSLVFGLIVAGVGCLRGMQTQSGPGAVGTSTTRAVVGGIVLTIVADAVLGVVFFYLGI